MQLSNIGIQLITEFEGCKLAPYPDSRGFATIGIGHLIRKAPVLPTDQSITLTQAYDLFRTDSSWASSAVNNLVKVPLNQNQFDALVCFTFNVGSGTLQRSDLLLDLNQSHYENVPAHMLSYNKEHVNGVLQVSAGLIRRRQAEVNLYQK